MSHVNPYSDQTCFDNGYLFLLPGNIIIEYYDCDIACSEVQIYLYFTAIVGFQSALATYSERETHLKILEW